MNTKSSASRWYPRFSIRSFDVMFALLLAGAMFLIADNGIDGPNAEALAEAAQGTDAWFSFALLAIALPAIAILLAVASKIDRRCSEDYVYQLIANASVVATTTLLAANVLWDIAATFIDGMRPFYADDFVAVTLIGWSTGWFVFRVRGIAS